jgi:hypothetical protein
VKKVLTLADPYDPTRPSAVIPTPTPVGGNRFEIHKGANNHDKTNTTLVVEGIPAGKTPPQFPLKLTKIRKNE